LLMLHSIGPGWNASAQDTDQKTKLQDSPRTPSAGSRGEWRDEAQAALTDPHVRTA
jgi:hypothetical protein